jgi:hypothetical protein
MQKKEYLQPHEIPKRVILVEFIIFAQNKNKSLFKKIDF